MGGRSRHAKGQICRLNRSFLNFPRVYDLSMADMDSKVQHGFILSYKCFLKLWWCCFLFDYLDRYIQTGAKLLVALFVRDTGVVACIMS
jgi:hypothetical protein